MNLGGLFRVASQALVRNALRSLLTMLGIIIGVAAVITSMAIGNGAAAAVAAQFARLGSNLIIVFPGSFSNGGVESGSGGRQNLTPQDASAIQDLVPAVTGVSPTSQVTEQVLAGGNNWSTSVTGTTPNWVTVQAWIMAQGRFFTDDELRRNATVAVVGQTVLSNLFPSGDSIGKTIIIGKAPFTVIGTLAPKGRSGFGRDQDDQIVVPLTALQLRLQGTTSLSLISISAQSPDAVSTVISTTEALLRLRHGLTANDADDFTVGNLSNIQQAFSATAKIQSTLLASIAAVSLIVGGIGIMNIMLVSVTERTREIGTRMAVGARERDILLQFLVEAVALSCIGGILGILMGVAASQVTSAAAGWSVLVAPSSVILAFTFAALIGIIFGFYPARRASLLNPIEALRHE